MPAPAIAVSSLRAAGVPPKVLTVPRRPSLRRTPLAGAGLEEAFPGSRVLRAVPSGPVS